MAGYGSIDGYQADDDDLPAQREGFLPSVGSSRWRRRLRRLLARSWVRTAIAACLLAIIPAISSRLGSLKHAPSSTPPGADDGFGDETRELFYHDQLVNHLDDDDDDDDGDDDDASTWSNRYYQSTKYFGGPGHPVFLIVGGEDALEGMLYPFVTRRLAKHFGAAVINIEHRFYGPYQPIMGRKATVEELLELLTLPQAMADMVRLTRRYKEVDLNCSSYDRSSEEYCPVITVGGSYPGVLSALFRLVHPDFVDMSYASSAPLVMHAQRADQDSFYDIVTETAERTSEGCENAVRSALEEANMLIRKASSVEEAARSVNVCADSVPEYIADVNMLGDDVMMAIGFTFADYDMDAYPPGEDLQLYKACRLFQDEEDEVGSLDKVSNFFQLLKETGSEEEFPGLHDRDDCFDLSVFLPDGKNARIATSDWTGAGGGNDGMMWDFQMCTTYIAPVGFSERSMFPARKWTLDDLAEYCRLRYGEGVTPRPYALVEEMGIDDLVGNNASRILFTNGMRDLWSGGSHLEDLSNSILAINFENGAHHSDLTHVGPSERDTEDIREGFDTITNVLQGWLDQIN